MYEYINKFNRSLKETVLSDNSTINYIIEFDIDAVDLKSHPLPDTAFSFFSEVLLNDTIINNQSDIVRNLKFFDEDNANMQFLFKKKFSLEDKILLYSNDGLERVIEKVLEMNVDKISSLKKEISLNTFIKDPNHFSNNIKSSLFAINDAPKDLTEETINLIKKNKNSDAIVGLVSNVIDEISLKNFSVFPFIKSLLSFISNEKKRNEFYFKGKFNLTIKATSYDDSDKEKMFSHFKSLKTIYDYLNSSSVTLDQKRTFIRKTFCDKLTQDKTIKLTDLHNNFFDDIYKDSCFLFDTFENNEVSIFLKEKKEVLKEYLSLLQDTNTKITQVVNNLVTSLITVMTLLITNSVLFLKSVFSINIFLLILTFNLLLIIFFLIVHIKINSVEINNLSTKKEIFSKHFSFLSSESESIKNDMENLVNNELSRLSSIFDTIKYTYQVLIFIFMLIISFHFPI